MRIFRLKLSPLLGAVPGAGLLGAGAGYLLGSGKAQKAVSSVAKGASKVLKKICFEINTMIELENGFLKPITFCFRQYRIHREPCKPLPLLSEDNHRLDERQYLLIELCRLQISLHLD